VPRCRHFLHHERPSQQEDALLCRRLLLRCGLTERPLESASKICTKTCKRLNRSKRCKRHPGRL
jgi:hypothetical protein